MLNSESECLYQVTTWTEENENLGCFRLENPDLDLKIRGPVVLKPINLIQD